MASTSAPPLCHLDVAFCIVGMDKANTGMLADQYRGRRDRHDRLAQIEHFKRVMSIALYLFFSTLIVETVIYVLIRLWGIPLRLNQ